jgi:4-hydroxyphenylpyruvate dioxygenase-like putative hemolysin
MSSINVVVGRKRTVQVSANATAGIIDTSAPVTIKNIQTVGGGGITRLDKLTDVVANGEVDKATLVYDALTDKYVVKKMEFTDISGDLDGGTF